MSRSTGGITPRVVNRSGRTLPGSTSPPGLAPSWLAGREPQDGRPTAWICRGVSCSLPIVEPDAIDSASPPAALR